MKRSKHTAFDRTLELLGEKMYELKGWKAEAKRLFDELHRLETRYVIHSTHILPDIMRAPRSADARCPF